LGSGCSRRALRSGGLTLGLEAEARVVR
jgi:hypothetical protein